MSLCAHWLLLYEQAKIFPPFGIILHITFGVFKRDVTRKAGRPQTSKDPWPKSSFLFDSA